MRALLALSFLFVAAGCGRTSPFGERGETDETAVAGRSLAVFTSDGNGCFTSVSEAILPRIDDEKIELAELAMQTECSGAGGDWIVARLTSGRDAFLGAHACFFIEASLPDAIVNRDFPGLVWFTQTAAVFTAQESACIVDANAGEPVRSDVKVRAIAVYASKQEAKAALAIWDQ